MESARGVEMTGRNQNGHPASFDELETLREAIDEVDRELLALIHRRLALAWKIGRLKQDRGLRVLDRKREAKLLGRLLALNRGALLPDAALLEVFTRLIDISRAVQLSPETRSNISQTAALYAVIGCPVAHSLSPVMHHRAFRSLGLDARYLAIEEADIGRALDGIRRLGFSGASITLPHKESCCRHLDELDPSASGPGAVNTVVNRNGRLVGFNTDGSGALRALEEKAAVRDKTVGLIGAGGAARAIAFSIAAAGGRLVVLNRSRHRGERLAGDFGGEFRPLQECSLADCQILINATPVGMHPGVDETPLPADRLQADMLVMDAVYRPSPTRLLREARERGCATVSGVSMFVHQGAAQFELWTGQEAPLELMRLSVEAALHHPGP
jgi:shikimate dehydrogenase